jgi:hypothetical protein
MKQENKERKCGEEWRKNYQCYQEEEVDRLDKEDSQVVGCILYKL